MKTIVSVEGIFWKCLSIDPTKWQRAHYLPVRVLRKCPGMGLKKYVVKYLGVSEQPYRA